MAQQLTFDLPAIENRTRGDFFVAPSNALAFQTVDQDSAWPGNKLILTGAQGAGKTHLAHVWAQRAQAHLINARDLPELDTGALAGDNVVVDGADTIGANPQSETALFHLHNLILAEGGRLLLTARTGPRDWGLTLPDLQSRMNATAIAKLEPPDDALLAAVLVKLFGDRQIKVNHALISYLTTHMQRSLAEAATLVEHLDQAALRSKRAITRNLAADVLDNLDKIGS